jgi:hypothetical protein
VPPTLVPHTCEWVEDPKWPDGLDPQADDFHETKISIDDVHESNTTSPWYLWRANLEEPELAVLLLERLGDPFEAVKYPDHEQVLFNSCVDGLWVFLQKQYPGSVR